MKSIIHSQKNGQMSCNGPWINHYNIQSSALTYRLVVTDAKYDDLNVCKNMTTKLKITIRIMYAKIRRLLLLYQKGECYPDQKGECYPVMFDRNQTVTNQL
ncbi:MAG: hypothetical protein IGNPGNKH_00425 [Sodalis sp. Ffu]|nr:MAG: hypothetical protein IGNPGNKH_00425 [Sodalis sp. Ffu]